MRWLLLLLHWVNPFIGTTKSGVYTRWGNEGGTYPGAVAPWGYMQLSPETKWGSVRGYDYHDSVIYVFSCTGHPSGFPGGSAGRFFVMPVLGGKVAGRPFSHAREVASPGYYSVRLDDDGTFVEGVATTRAGEFRIAFGSSDREIFVGDTVSSAFSFSAPFVSRRAVKGGEVFSFTVPSLIVKVSSATAGAANARRNMAVELANGFDAVRRSTEEEWRKVLSVVEVGDGDSAARTVFYTALYHSMLLPNVVSDVDGFYRGRDGRVHRVVGRREYGMFSPWDSYRSLHPLLSLLQPRRQREMMQSLMDEYREGGYLPIESMTGNHVVAILVDAWMKGIRGVDSAELYAAMLKSLVRGPFQQDDRVVYAEKGYIPLTYPESVTRTVEYGYDDWALSQYAGRVIRDTGSAGMLERRSRAWQKLLYTPSLLLLPRVGDSFRVKPGTSGYKEGDAWAYSFSAPQDAEGLINRMGGAADFAARLDSALSDGRIVFDNETVVHVPYFFNAAERYDLTRKWVRASCERYRNEPGGLPGNDDLGAMSSWYVFSALGFFPFCPGKPVYSVGAPLFDKVTLHLGNGRVFVVRRGSGGPMELMHSTIMKGGEIVIGGGPEFVLSSVKVGMERLVSGSVNWVRFLVSNAGETGVKRVPLVVGGKLVGSYNRLLASGEKVFDSIGFRMYKSGEVAVVFGGVDAGRVMVMPASPVLPPLPEVSSPAMRVMMPAGENLRVRFGVMNVGWAFREFRLPVRVDGSVVGMDTVALDAGETRERSMVFGAGIGWHVLEIGDSLRVRFRVYGKPEDAVVLDLDSSFRDRSGFGNDGVREERSVVLPRSLSLNDLGERLTMLMWVKPEEVKRGLVDVFTNGDNHVLQIVDGRQLTFFAGGWGRGDCTVEVPADWVGHWHLIAGVCDAAGLKVYIDGVQRGFTPLENSVHLTGGENVWMIGRNEEFPGQRIYNGEVRRPRIFQEALPAEAILSIYRKESSNP